MYHEGLGCRMRWNFDPGRTFTDLLPVKSHLWKVPQPSQIAPSAGSGEDGWGDGESKPVGATIQIKP